MTVINLRRLRISALSSGTAVSAAASCALNFVMFAVSSASSSGSSDDAAVAAGSACARQREERAYGPAGPSCCAITNCTSLRLLAAIESCILWISGLNGTLFQVAASCVFSALMTALSFAILSASPVS